MSTELLASKIVVQEEDPQTRQIVPVATAVLAIAGVTERGPHARTLVSSPEEYQNTFGGYTTNGKVKQALDGFFLNGGVQAYVKRVVHYTDVSSAATKTSAAATITLQTAVTAAFAGSITGSIAEPYSFVDTDKLDFSIDGGGTDTATFNCAAAEEETVNSDTYDLADGLTLTLKVDRGAVQTVTFNTAEFSDIANATAEEVAAVINAETTGCNAIVTGGTKVQIWSDTRGTGSYIEITGGTANSGGANRLAFPTSEIQGTGDAVDASAVTAAEIATLINGDVAGCTASAASGYVTVTSDNTPGPGATVQVEATSTMDDEIGFDNATHSGGTGAATNTLKVDGKTDGTYANTIRIIIAAATSGDSTEFNLSVEEDGVVVEVFPNLSMTDALDNYVETVINATDGTGSNLIAVTDQDAGTSDDRPATGTSSYLTGGDDGLTSLDDNDFVGAAAGETGIRGFDDVDDVTLLAIPDRPTSAVHNAMLTYCETTRDKSMFAVLDPPASTTASGMVTYVETTAALLNASEFGAIYWPQVQVLNPNKTVFGGGDNITVPPSGHIAGVYARTDSGSEGGVWKPPAGIEEGRLLGVVGFETEEVKKVEKRDVVFPKRINPLTVFTGAPRHIDGARTLKSNGNFPSVSERRGAIFTEQSIKNGLQWARHKNNTPELRSSVERTVFSFMKTQMNNGAFRTSDPATAFFVDFGDGLNPASVQFAGKLIGRVGMATNKPTEYIILRFSQDTRAFDEEAAQA